MNLKLPKSLELHEPEVSSASAPAVESGTEHGSAAKAADSLARFCPRLSMAPDLAIVEMVAALS